MAVVGGAGVRSVRAGLRVRIPLLQGRVSNEPRKAEGDYELQGLWIYGFAERAFLRYRCIRGSFCWDMDWFVAPLGSCARNQRRGHRVSNIALRPDHGSITKT